MITEEMELCGYNYTVDFDYTVNFNYNVKYTEPRMTFVQWINEIQRQKRMQEIFGK